tara:strand:+ start:1675 stop:2631 length:957 start_codon:yes stop_codon:yes gene_type:complete
MNTFFDFEKPIAEIEGKIKELRHLSESDHINIVDEVSNLQSKVEKLLKQTYSQLTPWQKTQVARHPNRPHASDYVKNLFADFIPLAGDRSFGEDKAVLSGIGRFEGLSVMAIGLEKGGNTEKRVEHNFGMAKPEGYRKATRLMKLATRYGIPVVTFIDTPGAYPGVGAEERGQAEAIAQSTSTCLSLTVPLISVVIGEGGSGGAIALAAANHVIMLENSIYSVISPEGCASILWRDSGKAPEAATALRLTAQDLQKLNLIDEVVKEPIGGAHRAPQQTIKAVGESLKVTLRKLKQINPAELRRARQEKFSQAGTDVSL